MKKQLINLSFSILSCLSLIGCSETTHVEEKVNTSATKTTTGAAVAPNKDVNVNVKVGNDTPSVVHHDSTTRVINVEPKDDTSSQEKQVVINNNVSTPNTSTSVTKETTTDLDTGSTSTTTRVNTDTNY